MNGGDGDDTIYTSKAGNLVYADAGDDTLIGNTGNDLLHGGAGNDVLDGGAGNDRLFGEGGADTFRFQGLIGSDVIGDFEKGIDTIELHDILPGSINLAAKGSDMLITGIDGTGAAFSITMTKMAGQITMDDLHIS